MVGKNQSPNPITDSTKLRKVRKPLIEKKRRDRINNSLTQLKDLLAQATKQHGSANISRLDKADILEMTVRYLTQCQQQQSQTRETTSYSYSLGFKDCTRETMRYLRVSQALGTDQLYSLNSHLFGVYVAKTEADSSSEIRSIPAVQKILNGNVKPVNRARARATPSSSLQMKRETTSPFVLESRCLEDFNHNTLAADIGPVVSEEPIWRPW